MPRKANSSGGLSYVRAAIAVLALLAAARALWLAGHDPTPVGNALRGVPVASGTLQRTDQQVDVDAAEVRRLVAEISLVCPSAARELQQLELADGLAPSRQHGGENPPANHSAQQVSHQEPAARAKITSIQPVRRPLRVALNSSAGGVSSQSGDWLVDPGEWFVPEDSEVETQPPTKLQPPTKPRPVVAEPQETGDRGQEAGDREKETGDRGQVEVSPANPPPVVEAPMELVAPQPPNVEVPLVEETPSRPAFEPPPAKTQAVVADPLVDRAPLVEEAPLVLETPKVEEVPATPAFAPPPQTKTQAIVEIVPPVVDEPEIVEAPATPAFAPPPSAKPQAAPVPVAESFAPPPVGMPSVHSLDGARETAAALGIAPGVDPHAELLAKNCFPSAKTCAKCHEKIYHEWSCSSHAYAQVSPMFHKFEQKITEISKGTVGYFCQRCHSPVGTSMNIPRDMPLWQQPEVAREGVTCIACHRVNQRYGKSNGERRIVPGDENAPVYGAIGGAGVAEVIARKNEFKVKTSASEKGPGQQIHREGRYFDQLSASEYCSSCHQVAVHPGIKLEVVWEQYRASPAHKRGVTCQNCHMGKVPGVASGYERCAIAEVNGKKIHEDRQHSNHTFYGPGYSIAHPGVFPFHLKADRWTMDQWLQFDWRAGWGTDEFEERLDAGEVHAHFPPVWAEADDRYDAREIIDDNLAKLAGKTELRRQVMENGSHVDGPFFTNQPCVGQDLDLHYVVANTNDGHNLPTGSLGAQPQLWANVVLIGPRGERLWETGYTDHYGDVCDIHSRDVRAGRAPFDSQLFNLQTMFLITGAVGTDREFFLPVNVDVDQLPFLRPGAIPISVTNHPPFIRMEGKSLAPLGKKKVKYRIPGRLIREPGRYRLSFRLRSRTEPIYFMDFVGATAEMQRAMNEGMIDVHPYSVEFDVR